VSPISVTHTVDGKPTPPALWFDEMSNEQGRRRLVAARRATMLLSGEHCFAAVLGDSVAGMVVSNGINNFLNLYNTVLVVRLVLTWFPNTPPAIVAPLR